MLVLASASNARKSLLLQAGIEHKIIVSTIREDNNLCKDVKRLTSILARQKANNVFQKLLENKVSNFDISKTTAILACDSLFEFSNNIFGKPKSIVDALERWKEINGKAGYIHTGHHLIYLPKDPNKENLINSESDTVSKTVTTKIFFEKLTDKEIECYIKTKEPLSCAGGFAIDGIGGLNITKIEGCYSNVIGISLPWLRRHYLAGP